MMSANFNQLLYLLQQILECFQFIREQINQRADGQPMAATLPEKLLLKEEVIQYLHISERSYERFKQQGILQVMRLGTQDYMTPEALMAALQESIRKGKI